MVQSREIGGDVMYLQVGNNKGRKYLSIVQGYRDLVTKKVRHKTVKSLGYLDDLAEEHEDPIAHFKAAFSCHLTAEVRI